jgi:two-component system sensor histidine kinase/response regulator
VSNEHHSPTDGPTRSLGSADDPGSPVRKSGATFEALANDNLRPGSVGAALTFCFLLLGQLASFPREAPFPWPGVVLAAIALLIAARAAFSKRRVESAMGGLHVAEAGIALAALVHSLVVVVATRSIEQTTHVLLLVIAAGCVMLYAQWLAVVITAAAIGWAAVVFRVIPPDPSWPHFAYAFALAGLLSIVIFITRVRVVERLEGARKGEHERRAELEAAMRTASTSEARFRQLLVATTEGIVIHRNGIVLDVSDNAARMLKTPYAEILGRRIEEFIERRSGYELSDAESARQARLREATLHTADGRAIPIEYDTRSIEYEGRGAEVLTFRDATPHKRMLESMADQRAWEHAVIESALDCIVCIDGQGVIVEWNRAAEQTFGWRRDEVIGQSVRDLIVPPVYRDAFDAELAEYAVSRTSRALDVELEGTMLRRDGSDVSVEFGVTATDGTSSSIITAYVRDVSDRKDTERELAKARDQAIRASTVKSEFLATMSHEIRTPMNGVLGMTSLLLGTELSSVQRRHALAIEHSAKALLGIINDILDFSKIEAGRIELEHMTFDLTRLLAEITDLLGEKARSKGIELTCEVESDVPNAVVGDPVRVRQVVTNLVDNAIKYTDRGEVSLHVMLACDGSDDKRVLLFEVRDSGQGVPPDVQSKLFNPFVQGDASMTRRHGGTGLGLAICRRLVELMGGEIGLESRVGEGSTFWFTVQLEKGVNRAASAQDTLAGRRVLLVSDHEKSGTIVAGYLRSWAMECETATTPVDGLAALDAAGAAGTPWDVVLVDHAVAGNGGLDFARTVRSDASHLRVPLVLITALSSLCTSDVSESSLVTDVVTKPVSKSHLFDSLLQIVSGMQRKDREAAPGWQRKQPVVETPVVIPVAPTVAPSTSKRILIAEDNPINQEVAALMLEHLGYEVAVAASGVEALAALQKDAFALVLMDCQMPEMDGFTAAAAIRSRTDVVREIPIIAMTANAMKGDRERCMAAGMDDYIAKPIDPKDLAAKIAKWCADAAGIRRGESAPAPDASEMDRSVALVARHLAETEQTLLALRAALSRHDEVESRRLCELLRGRSAEIGAWRMVELAEEVTRGEFTASNAALSELEQEFDQVKDDLGVRADGSRPSGADA